MRLRWVKPVLVLLVLVMVFTAPLAAAIRPGDQRLARTLSLRLDDFGRGWKRAAPPSDKFSRNPCPSAPNIEHLITGYNSSALFRPVDDDAELQQGRSLTRIFSSEAAARQWFKWAGGGKQASCIATSVVADWSRSGYRVTGRHVARKSLKASCRRCPRHDLAAWSIRLNVSKAGETFTAFFDWVALRVGRAVIGFDFYDVDTQFVGAAPRVANVLKRGTRSN
jgi:hypothetical protein